MSALIVEPPFEIFTDIDGQPLEAGYVWIGTPNLDPQTNPVQVYWDQALTILAPQPLRTIGGYIVNSGTPAKIYIDGASYSIRVMNKNGSTLYTDLNNTGIDPNASGVAFTGFKGQVGFVSDLADDDGSDWIGFEPNGASAVARSAQDKMRDFISVKDFGAVGDGVADDTAAIQTAISQGRIIYMPPGVYRITSTLVFAQRAKIYGEPGLTSNDVRANTVIKWDGAVGGVMFQAAASPLGTPSTVQCINLVLNGLVFDGDNKAGIGVYGNYVTQHSEFTDVFVTRCNLFGFLLGKMWYASFNRISAVGCKGIGIAIGYNYLSTYDDASVNGVNFFDIRAHSCGDTYANNPATGYDASLQPWGGCGVLIGPFYKYSTTLQRSVIERNLGSGISVICQPNRGPRGVRDVYFEGNGGLNSIYIEGSNSGTFFFENIFDDENISGTQAQSAFVYCEANGVQFLNATGVYNTGSVPVFAPLAVRGTNIFGQSLGGEKFSSVKGYVTQTGANGTSPVNEAVASLLPAKTETTVATTGALTLNGVEINFTDTQTQGHAGITLLVTFTVNTWASISATNTIGASTRSYIVNIARRQRFVSPATSDYATIITEIGTAATVFSGISISGLAVSASSTATKIILEGSYTVGASAGGASGYGTHATMSAVVLNSNNARVNILSA
jgi:hypothetical protein